MMQSQQPTVDMADGSIPNIALQWVLSCSVSNNSDLAILSNVCKQWRQNVLEYLKEGFAAALEGRPKYNALKGLFLPDMAFEIAKRRLIALKMASPLLEQESDAFCLAWFHPRGIKIKTVDLAENYEESSSSDDDDDNEKTMSYKFHLKKGTKRLSGKSRSKMSSEFKTVAEEWQGYRNATDVLYPFGYATAFVRDFLQHAAEFELKKEKSLLTTLLPPMIPSNTVFQVENVTKPRTTTFSVRGATFARPHGFCLCWADKQQDVLHVHDEIRKRDTTDEEIRQLDTKDADHRMQMYKLKAVQKGDKKRRIRMRDSLPRTCQSTLAKNPDLQGQFGQMESRRQRCIQFLNADKNRAVYMRTHPFDCGPIQAPVTIFLVAIATEDGCFVSGLRRRFELGHLYGDRSDDSMDEMSPICLATETSKPRAISGGYQDIDSDDSSMLHRVEEYGDANCKCKIQWKQKFDRGSSYDEDEGEESSYHSEVDENRIVRGVLGPGRWHVYTATFDGKRSTIRIDGVDEPVRAEEGVDVNDIPILDGLTIGSDHLFDMSLCFGEGSEGEGAGSIAELAVFKGAMDQKDIINVEEHLMRKHGIIHGSTGFVKDPASKSSSIKKTTHVRNLSETNELRTRADNQWQEDQWKRDVHSLMTHPPPCLPPSGSGIPLRVATRHRSVAWYRCCEVTGKPLRVSRIGSKLSNGSSDW